ncbi:MAG: EamA family transporter [Alphaproteobacteria bacterium]|nr:EamA family transporter [Alphaproteobacteria bacterium]
MSNHIKLLLLATLIAGSSWIMVPTQISSMPYSLSIGYRFIIAGSLILLYCMKTKVFSKISLSGHLLLMFQGLCMYCLAHSLSYNATAYMPTGVIALFLAFTIVPNTILGTIISGDKLTLQFLKGSFVSLIGIVLVFYNDLNKVSPDILSMIGFSLVVGAMFVSSVGTVLSKVMMRRENYPIMLINGFAMLYGGVFSILKHFMMGGSLVFDFSYSYVLPLIYLSIIVTPLVFGIYLKLAKEVSAGFAGYIWLFTPVLALNLSIFFEDFEWTIYSLTGTILVVMGGLLSSKKERKKLLKQSSHHPAGL